MANALHKARKGEAQRFYREVVSAYDGDDCLIWPFTRVSRGHAQIRLNGKLHYVHRLMCEQAHGPAPTRHHEAAHSCGNGHLGCVSKRHQRWATAKENAADRVSHGTIVRGEKSWASILSEDDVRTIRRLCGTLPQKDIAEMFGVSRPTVSNIVHRRKWAWLE